MRAYIDRFTAFFQFLASINMQSLLSVEFCEEMTNIYDFNKVVLKSRLANIIEQ